MKKRFLSHSIALVLIGWGFVDAKAQQPLKVGTNPTNINRSAVLDVEANNKGALLPRIALTSLNDVTTIANPANALTVFNTATAGTAPDNVTPGYYYYSTAVNKWVRLLSQGDASSTTVSNTSSTNNLTTTVNGVTGSAVNIINSNTLTAASNAITSTVNGVTATLTPTAGGTIAENLGFNAAGNLVRQTASTTSQNIYNTDGTLTNARTINTAGNFLNFRSNSASAPAYVSYGRTATEMDMGVTGSNDNGFKGTVAGDSWLAGTSNLYVGTRGAGSLRLITGAAGAEVTRLSVTNTGNVGIGIISPNERLEVIGNIRFSGALMPNNAAGTAGQVLTSAGVSAPPTWNTPSNIYTADGTLTSARTVNTAGNFLNFRSNSASALAYVSYGRTATEMDMGVAGGSGNGLDVTAAGDSWLAGTNNLYVGTRGTGSFNVVTGQAGSGVTRLSVTNTGNVGIGIIAPNERLEVSGNIRFSGALMPNNAAGTAGQVLTSAGVGAPPTWNTPSNIYTADGTLTSARTVNTAGNLLNFRSNSASALAYVSYGRTATEMDMGVAGANTNGLDVTTPGDSWLAGTNNLYVGTRGGGSFNVVTGAVGAGATRMTVNSVGRVGIGLTTPTVKLHVGDGNIAATSAGNNTGNLGNGSGSTLGVVLEQNGKVTMEGGDVVNLTISKTNGFNTSFPYASFLVSGSSVGEIRSNAGKNGVLYNTTSDMRLKENIVPTHLGLSAVNNIKVYDYNFKTDTDKTPQTGFLAQELFKIFPQAVSVGGDDPKKNPWAVDYGKLTPLLVKAIQEQQVQIEALKKEIENLKNK